MRRRLILTVLSLFIALIALGPLVPAGTHARQTALTRPSAQISITGTIVATPQPTPPTTLLVQVGGQTIAVLVSYGTLIMRGDTTTVALNQLNDGDTVQISGNSLANGAINASQIIDFSLPASTSTPTPTPQPPLPLTVQGTLVSVLSGPILCLVNASVTGNALQPRAQFAGPCSYGQQPVYVTGTTQYLLSDGSATSLGKLLGGDTLQVVGTLANGQFTASLIRDLSQSIPTPTPQPPVALRVVGILAYEPNGTTLCLQVTSVSSNALAPNAQYCPAPGQLPVLLTGTTQYQLSDGTAASLNSLRIGETLQISGVLVNGQFTASQVTDLSQSTPPPPVALTLTGTLVSQQGGTLLCLLNTSVTGSALQPRVQIAGPCSSGQQPVYVNAATQYSLSDGTGASLASLHPADTLQVTGLVANGQFTATQIKDLSQATPPPPVALTVQGYLASVPSSTVLCLQLTGVAGNTLSPRALTASPCQYNQLPVYLSGNTQFRLNDGTAASLASLRRGDALLISGTAAGNQFTAAQIRDLSRSFQYVYRLPATLTAQGTLYAAPGQFATPLLLCLRNASVLKNGYRQSISLTSICPAGQFPVTISGATTFVRRYDSPSALDELRAGDILQVTGTVSNGQFTASRIKNLSIQAPYTTVVGKIVSATYSTNGVYVTILVQRDASGRGNLGTGQYVTVFVQVNTQIVNVYGASSHYWELASGQSVTLLGTSGGSGQVVIQCFRLRIR